MAKDDRLPSDFFDYNEITDEHREAAAEVLKYLEERNAAPDHLTSRLKIKFGLEQSKKEDVDNCKVYRYAKQYGIYCVQNGYLTQEDGNEIPIIRIESDMKRLDEFLEFAKIMSEEENSDTESDEE